MDLIAFSALGCRDSRWRSRSMAQEPRCQFSEWALGHEYHQEVDWHAQVRLQSCTSNGYKEIKRASPLDLRLAISQGPTLYKSSQYPSYLSLAISTPHLRSSSIPPNTPPETFPAHGRQKRLSQLNSISFTRSKC